jgi:hypothetical protein
LEQREGKEQKTGGNRIMRSLLFVLVTIPYSDHDNGDEVLGYVVQVGGEKYMWGFRGGTGEKRRLGRPRLERNGP